VSSFLRYQSPADRERIDEAARITNRESIVTMNVTSQNNHQGIGQEYKFSREDDRPKKQKGIEERRNVQSEIRNMVYRRIGETFPTCFGACRVLLINCSPGEDNEAQKEDPGEGSREAVVDDQEPLLAPPLLRIGNPRARLSRYSRCCRWDCQVLTFLGIRSRCGER
jgi:hypothetical protein